MGEGTGEGAGEAGAAGSFSSLVLLLLWFLSTGPVALRLSFASSFLRTRPLGDAVMPRGDGGLGGRAWPGPGLGQGEAGLCQDVEGEDGRALALGLREKEKLGFEHSGHTHTHPLSRSFPQGSIPPRQGSSALSTLSALAEPDDFLRERTSQFVITYSFVSL